MSRIIMSSESITDISGQMIFNGKNKFGYLVFIDPIYQANWSHECEYYFITLNGDIISVNGKWPPNVLNMEKIWGI